MDDLNYFELLDLDPNVADSSLVEKRLQEKQRLWSRQATEGTPRDARLAARNLKLLDVIRRALADPASRSEMASQARQRKEQRQRESRARLSELLEFARDKIEDLDAFVTRDCARYVRELGKPEVLRLITASGIKAKAPRQADAQAKREALEATTAKRIRDGLEHLGKRDLYEFLGLTRRCTARSLRDRAEQLNRTLLQSGRSDDQTSAGKELAGQCMAVFAGEDGKERYNNTLTEERLEAALKDFLSLAGQGNVLGQKEMAALLAIANRQGISSTDASAYIRSVAQRRRWAVVDDKALPPEPELPRCGYCGCLARSADDTFCWNCNRKLSILCPRCGKDLPSSQKSCTDCGANIEDAEIVEACIKQARECLEAGDDDHALDNVNRCLSLWPDWSDAVALKEQIDDKHRRQQAVAQRLVVLLRDRRMLAAQDCLEQARKDAAKDAYTRAADIVSRSLADANRCYLEGEQHQQAGRVHEAASCYEQALSLCSDLEPALERLRELPPIPPAELRAEPLGPSGVRLVWKPGKDDALFEYTVTRKANGAPAYPADGDVVLEHSGATAFDDIGTPGGVAWHYAVFSLRKGIPSAQAATAGPLFLTPPVTDLLAQADDGHARLEWTLPGGAVGVEIRRSEDAFPERPEDGTDVPAAPESTLDTGLSNGRAYYYAIFAMYNDPDHPSGRRHSSPTVCRVMPLPHLDPIEDLLCVQLGDTVYLRWTPPPTGSDLVLCASDNPVYEPGQAVPLDALKLCGEAIPTDGAGKATFTLDCNSRVSFIPVTVQGHLAMPGIAAAPVALCDVRDIAGETGKGELELTWIWPEQVEEVTVCWSLSAYPEDPDADTPKALCSLDEYQARGCFAIPTITPQKHYVTVFANVPGRQEHTAGTRFFTAMGIMDTVRYRVEKPGLFRKVPRYIELHSTTLSKLTDVQVRAKENCVPLTVDDGQLLVAAPELLFQGKLARIEIPERFRHSRLLIKLFLGDPEHAQAIRLMPGHTDDLKLW